jgi:hypothetical protein
MFDAITTTISAGGVFQKEIWQQQSQHGIYSYNEDGT